MSSSGKSRPKPAVRAVQAIAKWGACLVFPMDNRPQPLSLWHALYPRSQMRWEWDEGGDNRVSTLWHLRSELSTGGRVVYGKWFRGRATFFSKDTFRALLAYRRTAHSRHELSLAARQLLDAVEDNSPQSTKMLKKAAGLTGKIFEATYTKALKELWERGWIVAWGEFDDGAFPSLGIGATSLLFEPLWNEAKAMSAAEGEAILLQHWGADNPFWRELQKQSGPSGSIRTARSSKMRKNRQPHNRGE